MKRNPVLQSFIAFVGNGTVAFPKNLSELSAAVASFEQTGFDREQQSQAYRSIAYALYVAQCELDGETELNAFHVTLNHIADALSNADRNLDRAVFVRVAEGREPAHKAKFMIA